MTKWILDKIDNGFTVILTLQEMADFLSDAPTTGKHIHLKIRRSGIEFHVIGYVE